MNLVYNTVSAPKLKMLDTRSQTQCSDFCVLRENKINCLHVFYVRTKNLSKIAGVRKLEPCIYMILNKLSFCNEFTLTANATMLIEVIRKKILLR